MFGKQKMPVVRELDEVLKRCSPDTFTLSIHRMYKMNKYKENVSC